MITSSTDIYRSLAGDALISAVAKVRIIEGNPSLNPEDGVIIYISKYPQTTEFEASWFVWIVDFDNEPLDVVVNQIRRNFPGFQVLENGAIIRGVLTEVKTTRTDIAPPAPQKISIEPYLEALNGKFEELRESIEDRMLLVNSGRPGKDGATGRSGRDGRDGKDGRDLVATDAELGDLQDVFVDDAKKDQVLTYDGETWIAKFAEQHYGGNAGLTQGELSLLQGMKEGGEPMGFVDRADSTITFDDASRTITIAPVGDNFVVWVKAKRFVINQPASVQIPDTTGLYFVFFDTDGNIGYQTDYFYWDSEAPAAYIYWDADANVCPYLADERHGIVLDWQTHEYLHRTRGAAFANGFNILNFVINGDTALDSSAQFDLTGGTFFDEDLQIDISHSATPDPALFQQDLEGPARCDVFYQLGSAWKKDAATNFAFKMAATRPYYNSKSGSTWVLTETSNNRYVNYYIVATHNLRAPIVSLMGQAEHVNISDAQAEDFGSLDLAGFPSKEFRFLYKIILKTGNFTNSVDAIIAGVQDLKTYAGQFVAALDIGSIRLDQLDEPISSVSMGSQAITNLLTPSNSADAANKSYVDSSISSLGTVYQPLDADLSAIAALTATDGFLKKTAANTWSLEASASGLTDAPSDGKQYTRKNAAWVRNDLRLAEWTEFGTYFYNIAMGLDALASAPTSGFNGNNIALGWQAGKNIITGRRNIGIGTFALGSTINGSFNVAVGDGALSANTTGYQNVALGYQTLYNNTTGFNNIALGEQALYRNTTGTHNVGIGSGSLAFNTTGTYNVALGWSSLGYNTEGHSNTGIGQSALFQNTTGNFNVAVGAASLRENTTGVGNSGFGTDAVYANTTGNYNTGVGYQCLHLNTTGNYNTGVGHQCLYLNTTGIGNVAVGSFALNETRPADYNSAFGFESLKLNSTGYWNTALGGRALISNKTGYMNTSIGFESMFYNQSGLYNTALGFRALNQNTNNSNTCIGAEAGFYITSGGNNTCIGLQSGADAVANLTTASNYVVIGNNSTANANIKVAWTITSDARDKCNIATCPHGLAFVSSLKPVRYEYRKSRESDQPATDGRPRYGFLAQDILELEAENPVIIDDRDPDSLKFNEASLVPVLVNAIQELSDQVVNLNQQIEELKLKIT